MPPYIPSGVYGGFAWVWVGKRQSSAVVGVQVLAKRPTFTWLRPRGIMHNVLLALRRNAFAQINHAQGVVLPFQLDVGCASPSCRGCCAMAHRMVPTLRWLRRTSCILVTAAYGLTPDAEVRAETLTAAFYVAQMLAELPVGHGAEAN